MMLRRIFSANLDLAQRLSKHSMYWRATTNQNTIDCSPSLKRNRNSIYRQYSRDSVLNLRSFSIANQLKEPPFKYSSRCLSDEASSSPSHAEMSLINILKDKFPSATDIAVVDISGGCGSMYEVYVESPDFKGIRLVKQHQMVSEALKGEIKEMHGIRISTSASK